MTEHITPTAHHEIFWEQMDGCPQEHQIIGGPEEGPDVRPCHALIGRAAGVVHVPFHLDEIDLAHLARGGTLWLTTWGSLPIHRFDVQPPEVDQ